MSHDDITTFTALVDDLSPLPLSLYFPVRP